MKSIFLFIFILTINNTYASKLSWFKGSVEEGFKQAKKENRPLFLYWGAVWCPPCNLIKKEVFTSKVFQEEMKNYIPIYLDGDKANAQKWGDHFKTSGYPTMLILNPLGKEINRMGSGLKAQAYVEILKQTRLSLTSIEEVLNKALSNKALLNDYKRLAGYSWSQDKLLQSHYLNKAEKAKTFQKLYQNSKKIVPLWISAKFFIKYHFAKYELDKKYKASAKEIATALKLFNDFKNLTGSYEYVFYYPKKLIALFGNKLKSSLLKLTKTIRDDQSFSFDEKLSSFYPDYYFSKVKSKEREQIKIKIRTLAGLADKTIKSSYERHYTMSTVIWILQESNQLKLAKSLAIRESKKSKTPYYFQSYIAAIEEQKKNYTSALEWYKKAWHSAKGSATRFQWGTTYLRKLLTLSPNAQKIIQSTTSTVMTELVKETDALNGRNNRRLVRLKKSLLTWKKDNKHSFKMLISTSTKICKLSKNDKIKKSCYEWFASI